MNGARARLGVATLAGLAALSARPAAAEVMDKMAGPATLWFLATVCVAAAFALARWRPWAAFAPSPAAALVILGTLGELNDPHMRAAILAESGMGHFVQSFAAAGLIGAGAAAAWLAARRRGAAERDEIHS